MFTVYLTTISVSQTIHSPMVEVVNNKIKAHKDDILLQWTSFGTERVLFFLLSCKIFRKFNTAVNNELEGLWKCQDLI